MMKFYEKTWFMWLMLVFFFPVGLFLLWKYSAYSNKAKGIITCLIIGLLIFSNSTDEKAQPSSTGETVKQATVKQSGVSKKITKHTGLTPEQANGVEAILSQCGVTEIDTIKHDEILDNSYGEGGKGYRVKVNYDIENLIVYISKEGNVDAIRWASQNLYKEGMVISKVSDFYLTIEEQSRLQFFCEEAVKNILKAPKTADFPSIADWKFSKDKEKIIVQSHVDAQNSFGANLRSKFQFTFTPDGQTVKSLIFDGKKYDF